MLKGDMCEISSLGQPFSFEKILVMSL